MNSRWRVNGSRTVEPQQHHSTQENGPSKASRCVGGRLSSAGRCGFGPGVHETLKQVQALYAQMIGSADRAEQAVKRMDVAIARMEGLERRIDAAYNALDQAIKSETQHWSRWTYFTVGVLAGIIGGLVVLVIPPAVRYVASLRWWS